MINNYKVMQDAFNKLGVEKVWALEQLWQQGWQRLVGGHGVSRAVKNAQANMLRPELACLIAAASSSDITGVLTVHALVVHCQLRAPENLPCSTWTCPSSSRHDPWITQSSCSGSRHTGTRQQVQQQLQHGRLHCKRGTSSSSSSSNQGSQLPTSRLVLDTVSRSALDLTRSSMHAMSFTLYLHICHPTTAQSLQIKHKQLYVCS